MAKASNSRYCAWSSFSVPETFFIDLIWADPPTRLTEIPTLMAGRTPDRNRLLSKKIWPSVMEITFVGMYADTSPACVSMMGRAVRDPPPFTKERMLSGKSFMSFAMPSSEITFAARSNRRLCR